AAADAPAATVTAQAAVVITPGSDPIAAPAAQLPDEPQVDLSGWSSSADQPVAQIGQASSVVSSVAGATAGKVDLTGLSLFGGELQLGSLSLAASSSAGSTAVDVSGQQLSLGGVSLDLPAAGAAPQPLADWGQISTGVTLDDATTTEVLGLRVEVLADHAGLPAGSEIRIGVI